MRLPLGQYSSAGFGFLNDRTDVAAAYSLRRLRAAYFSPMVRLRRASDNAEMDFGAGLQWLDYGAVTAWAGGDAFATTFYDQSGNGRNLVQATAANQPQIILASNGKTALLHDGSNDAMQTAAFVMNQPWSFNIVYRRIANLSGTTQNTFDGITADKGTLFSATAGPFNNALHAGSTGPTGDDSVSMALGVRGAVGGTFNNASSLLEVNATTIASFTGTCGASNMDGLTLACTGDLNAARFSNMEVQEWCVFNAAHTSAQLKADSAAMRAAWGF